MRRLWTCLVIIYLLLINLILNVLSFAHRRMHRYSLVIHGPSAGTNRVARGLLAELMKMGKGDGKTEC